MYLFTSKIPYKYLKTTKITWARLLLYFLGQQGKSSNGSPGLQWSGKQCQTSTDLKPRPLLQLPLVPGPRYRVWTVPVALADSLPGIGPLPFCWLQFSIFLEGGVLFWSYVWWADASRKRTSTSPARFKPPVFLLVRNPTLNLWGMSGSTA